MRTLQINDLSNPRRGAGGVSIIWLVGVIVVLLVVGAMAFLSADEAAKNHQAELAALEKARVAGEDASSERAKNIVLSEIIGWEGEGAVADTDPEALKAAFDNFKSSFPDMDPTIDTVEKALPRAIEAYNQVLTKARNLEADVARLQGEVSSRDSQLSTLTSEKDGEIEGLRTQLSDLQTGSDERITSLESTNTDLRGQVQDKDQELKTAQGEIEDLARAAREAASAATSRMTALAKKLEFLDEPEAVDGEILAVSTDGTLGWINLGNQNRLARGTKFNVVRGKPGEYTQKGRAEVLHVKEDMAQVSFIDVFDQFNPPVAGDVIYNPVYDPKSERFAVLAGRFSGTWNKGELTQLLSELGITVQKEVDKTTDYLITGGEVYTDEDGEPLEEPRQPSELPVYQEAVAAGVLIVPLKDIRDYFGPR